MQLNILARITKKLCSFTDNGTTTSVKLMFFDAILYTLKKRDYFFCCKLFDYTFPCNGVVANDSTLVLHSLCILLCSCVCVAVCVLLNCYTKHDAHTTMIRRWRCNHLLYIYMYSTIIWNENCNLMRQTAHSCTKLIDACDLWLFQIEELRCETFNRGCLVLPNGLVDAKIIVLQ